MSESKYNSVGQLREDVNRQENSVSKTLCTGHGKGREDWEHSLSSAKLDQKHSTWINEIGQRKKQ